MAKRVASRYQDGAAVVYGRVWGVGHVLMADIVTEFANVNVSDYSNPHYSAICGKRMSVCAQDWERAHPFIRACDKCAEIAPAAVAEMPIRQ